jgi:hypothetical protein
LRDTPRRYAFPRECIPKALTAAGHLAIDWSKLPRHEIRRRLIHDSHVYPADARPADGRISVLSPVGAALLGESKGQEVELPLPHGQSRRIRILNVLYQPEAQGDFAL